MTEDIVTFSEFFGRVKEKLLASLPKTLPEKVFSRISDILSYNVPGGKLNRGKSVYETYLILKGNNGKSSEFTQSDREKLYILGWCIELLQAAFLVADDIMDGSESRRGQICWYLKKDIGLSAINDSFLLESCLYQLLRDYFRKEPFYIDLVDLFHQTSWQTELGQAMDLMTAQNHPDITSSLSNFTRETYQTIVVYKTAYYSFYLPVALAMIASGITDPMAFQNAQDILLYLGEFFQIQDDYLDCFGDPQVTGKVGTDIEECKCTWLVVEAIQRANDEDLVILKENYGRKDIDSVRNVKNLYQKLEIPQLYEDLESSTFDSFQELLKTSIIDPLIFSNFAQKIFKRNK